MREQLRNRAVMFGAWSVTGSPTTAETIGEQGFDYVCFDQQHGYVGIEGLLPLMQAVAGRSLSPIVRVPTLDTAWIGKALDYGSHGVIIPMVDTADEAAAAVRACRFPPIGQRSYAGTRGSTLLGGTPSEIDARIACIPMIETAKALENLDEICSVPGVDALYVGLGDLAISLGLQPQVALQEGAHVQAVARVGEACRAHGIGLGTHCLPGQPIGAYIDLGFTFLSVYSDLVALRETAAAAVASARDAHPGEPTKMPSTSEGHAR